MNNMGQPFASQPQAQPDIFPVGEGQKQPVVSVPGVGNGAPDQVTIDPQVVRLLGQGFFSALNSQNVDAILQALGSRYQVISRMKQMYMERRAQQQGGQPQGGFAQQPQAPAQAPAGAQMPQVPSNPATEMPSRQDHPFADEKHQGFVNGGLVRG